MSRWMRHPDLPADQVIEVDDLSVPHHAAAGWVVTDAPPPPPRPKFNEEPVPEAEAAASAAESVQQTPKSRRAPKEAEQ